MRAGWGPEQASRRRPGKGWILKGLLVLGALVALLLLGRQLGGYVIDFAEWPSDWSDFTDAQLCELLRQGDPLEDRRTASPPLRRYDDPRRLEN